MSSDGRLSSAPPEAPRGLLIALGLVLCLAASAAVVSLFVFQDGYANGFDGYYYALQARSILLRGSALSDDTSAVLWTIAGVAAVTGDAVDAPKVVGLLAACASVAGLYALTLRLTRRVAAAFFTALLWALSFFSAYTAYELIKNAAGNVFLIWFLFALAGAGEKRSWGRRIRAGVLLLLTLLCHKLAGATALLILVLTVAFRLRVGTGLPRKRAMSWIVAAGCATAALAAILLSLTTLRAVDLQRLARELDPPQALRRYSMILGSFHHPSIKAELAAIHLLCLWLPVEAWMSRGGFPSARFPFLAAMAVAGLVLLLPVTPFDWDSLGYRAMLQATPLAAVAAGLLFSRLVGGQTGRAPAACACYAGALALLLALGVALPARLSQIHAHHRPDYPRLAPMVERLPDLVPVGTRLIAYKGLSSFIWYQTGIATDHFVHADELESRWRVTYAVGPALVEPYREEGWSPPLVLDPPYYLMEERLWQKFYEARKADVPFLSSWQNPNQSRPPFANTLRGE